MKLKQLKLKNFRVYKEENYVEFEKFDISRIVL